MRPAEAKKLYEQNNAKLTANARNLKLKEAEKQARKKLYDDEQNEKQRVKETRNQLKQQRDEIRDEVKKVTDDLKKTQDETNRLKADLLYKTRREYEEMIRRFENELQVSGRPYSRHEESRLLDNIKTHRLGIVKLEAYENKKQICDQLEETYNIKKRERDENWSKSQEYKVKLSIISDSCGALKTQINQIDEEIKQLTEKKVELKKFNEDLTRENLMNKQQKFKKVDSENIKKLKNNKEISYIDINSTDRNQTLLITTKQH
jgi:chromosome segregation ATPase